MLAGGGGGDADALPALLAPRRHLAVSPRLQHREPAARGVCCAEPPLCILIGPSSAARGGAAPPGPSRPLLPAPRAPLGGAARGLVPKVCWEGAGAGGAEGPARHRRARERGGRRPAGKAGWDRM